MTTPALATSTRITFIGAGNMATAILGGLIRHGVAPAQLTAVDPTEAARAKITNSLGIRAHAVLADEPRDLLVWAIKPQSFQAAAQADARAIGGCAQLSIMAGIRLPDIARATGSERIVRCMPNTPALVGLGMTALFAGSAATAADKDLAEAVMRCAGETLWVAREELLDAVTALSGSGPAYVFYFLEAMQQAGTELGLTAAQARVLAQQTFTGATALAAGSDEALATLRERVTSKGGTTFAALSALENAGVKNAFVRAMHAAHVRAKELGDEFGRG